MDQPIHILIVEDSLSLRRLYTALLTRAGYAVLEAGSAAEAQTLVAAHRPDIVLLDRVLPDRDGSEICSWIKGTPEYAAIYVIMLSALRTSEDDRISGLEAGADDYIVKPVGKRELLARLNVAVRLHKAQRALAASEAQFRTLAENSPDVIMRVDPQGVPLYINPGIERILGMPPQAVWQSTRQGMGIPDALAERWYGECQAVCSSRERRRLELAFETPRGTRFLDTQFVPEFGPTGEVISILAVLRDFTERVLAEQAIARLAAVVEQTVEAVIITDPRGNIEYINSAFELLTGHRAPDLVGKNLRDAARGREGFCHQFLDAIATGTPWEGISYLNRRDGALCEIEATLFPIYDRGQTVLNYVALLRDLTERRRTEREREVMLTVASALRRASTRAEMVPLILDQVCALFNAAGAAFTVVDRDQGEVVVELARRSFAQATDLRLPLARSPIAQILAQGQPYLVQDEEWPAAHHLFGDDPTVRAILGVPLVAHNRSIGVLWMGSAAPLTSQHQGLLVAIADIAASALDRVALYHELERYAAELEVRVAERTRELESANAQLLTLDRLKSKFVSNVSHELRTPISNLKLYLSLLQRGKPERRPHYEAMLQTSAERLGQLVEDILSLSRLEIAHYQPRELALTDFNALVGNLVAMHQPKADAAGLALTFIPDAALPLIDGDFNQLSQLVTNLLANSLNYTRQGSVTVSTQWLSGRNWVKLQIQDTGVGILPEDVPHLFERFYRGNHRQADDIPGTGLGLAIVREIVDIHHGEIAVTSQVDVGTCIEVALPVSQAEWPRSAPQSTPEF